MAKKQTEITMPNGSEVRVRTDGDGTEVFHDDDKVYTTRGDQHAERVQDYERQGGLIIKGWGRKARGYEDMRDPIPDGDDP